MPVRTSSRYRASSSRSSWAAWALASARGEGADGPPGVGDDAVGAEVDAAVLDLQHGPGAALQAAGGQDLERSGGRWRCPGR